MRDVISDIVCCSPSCWNMDGIIAYDKIVI